MSSYFSSCMWCTPLLGILLWSQGPTPAVIGGSTSVLPAFLPAWSLTGHRASVVRVRVIRPSKVHPSRPSPIYCVFVFQIQSPTQGPQATRPSMVEGAHYWKAPRGWLKGMRKGHRKGQILLKRRGWLPWTLPLTPTSTNNAGTIFAEHGDILACSLGHNHKTQYGMIYGKMRHI